MPDYVITDPTTKRTVTLTGDSPPTEAELNDIFAKINAQPAAKAEAPKPSGMAGYQTLTDLATGAVKGAANTAIGLGQMVQIRSGRIPSRRCGP